MCDSTRCSKWKRSSSSSSCSTPRRLKRERSRNAQSVSIAPPLAKLRLKPQKKDASATLRQASVVLPGLRRGERLDGRSKNVTQVHRDVVLQDVLRAFD